MGKLNDGFNSMQRYYKNNFEDGFRQDSFDLLLGRHRVSPDEGKSVACPLARRNNLKIIAFPLFTLLALSALIYVTLLEANSWSEKTWNMLLCASAIATITMIMFRYGQQFVDYPTLVPLPRPPPPPSGDNHYYKDQ